MDVIKKIDIMLMNEMDLLGTKKDIERRVRKVIRYVIENPHRIPMDNWEDAFMYMGKKEGLDKKEMKMLKKLIDKKEFSISFETAKRYKGKGTPSISKLVPSTNLETFYLGR